MLKDILSKFLCFLFLLLIGALFISKNIYAVLEFSSDYTITYNIGPRGDAEVNQKVTLKNNFSNIYPKSYHIKTSGNKAQNIRASDSQGNIIDEIIQQEEETLIKLNFNEKSVGKNEELTFNVKYKLPQLAEKQGQVWRLNIPSLNNYEEINNLQLKTNVPPQFGTLSYSSIKPYKKDGNSLTFRKNQLGDNGISLVFGEFQLFDFKLSYYLKNRNTEKGQQKVPIPHDTNYQTVILDKIDPRPEKIISDEDNNWLAIYTLSPNEKKNILITGQAKIFAQPKQNINSKNDFSAYLKEDQYWPVKNKTFQSLASKFNNVTDIYNFVVNHLDYNYETLGDNKRLGAQAAYQKQSGVCTEFSDLFVTLARAKGIPARELEGFAFTNNKEIISLSADNDVLHSWPEYWDENQKQWIQVDPTWTKTTDGLDFIKNFDLGHFVFVTHGQSSTSPAPPGFYKTKSSQKNVEVDFATEILPSHEITLEPKIKQNKQNPVIIIKNKSLTASNLIQVQLLGWSGEKDLKQQINKIPPLGQASFKISPPSFWKRLLSNPKYKIIINGKNYELKWEKNSPPLKLQIKRLFANLLQK